MLPIAPGGRSRRTRVTRTSRPLAPKRKIRERVVARRLAFHNGPSESRRQPRNKVEGARRVTQILHLHGINLIEKRTVIDHIVEICSERAARLPVETSSSP